MSDPKPILHPLAERLTAIVDAHTDMHDAIKNHASEHVDALESRRRSLSLRNSATRLLNDNTTQNEAE